MEINHRDSIEQSDLMRTYSATESEDGNEGVGLDHRARLDLDGKPLC